VSSKLKKKTKKPIRKDTDWEKRVSNTDKLIEESYYNLRLISYQILHDKFGFGQKRIIRLEQTMDELRGSRDDVGISLEDMIGYMHRRYGIDVRAEVNVVPFRERFALTRFKIHADSQQSAGMYLLASICDYFTFLGIVLREQFKFSARQIREAYGWMRYYINTLSRPKQFELTIKDIAECLMEEVRYCDARFV
jgi:hypothetical protein